MAILPQIKHIIVVMLENRAFYQCGPLKSFDTFQLADSIAIYKLPFII